MISCVAYGTVVEWKFLNDLIGQEQVGESCRPVTAIATTSITVQMGRRYISPRTGSAEINDEVDQRGYSHDELEDLPSRREVAAKPEAIQHEARLHYEDRGEGVVKDVLGSQLPVRGVRVICSSVLLLVFGRWCVDAGIGRGRHNQPHPPHDSHLIIRAPREFLAAFYPDCERWLLVSVLVLVRESRNHHIRQIVNYNLIYVCVGILDIKMRCDGTELFEALTNSEDNSIDDKD